MAREKHILMKNSRKLSTSTVLLYMLKLIYNHMPYNFKIILRLIFTIYNFYHTDFGKYKIQLIY